MLQIEQTDDFMVKELESILLLVGMMYCARTVSYTSSPRKHVRMSCVIQIPPVTYDLDRADNKTRHIMPFATYLEITCQGSDLADM